MNKVASDMHKSCRTESARRVVIALLNEFAPSVAASDAFMDATHADVYGDKDDNEVETGSVFGVSVRSREAYDRIVDEVRGRFGSEWKSIISDHYFATGQHPEFWLFSTDRHSFEVLRSILDEIDVDYEIGPGTDL